MSASSGALRTAAALLCGVAMASALGQQAGSREQEQIRRLRQQVQQLQAEQAAQQQAAQRANAEATQAKTQLDAAASDLRRAQQATALRARSMSETQKELDTLRQEHGAMQAGVEALRTELQASSRTVETLRAERAQLQRSVAVRDAAYSDITLRHATQAQGLQTCIVNNQALHGLGRELLQRYVDKGVVDTAAQVEPFFQFRRVALENLVQGYQDKLDQQALKPAAGAASGAARGP